MEARQTRGVYCSGLVDCRSNPQIGVSLDILASVNRPKEEEEEKRTKAYSLRPNKDESRGDRADAVSCLTNQYGRSGWWNRNRQVISSKGYIYTCELRKRV